MSAGFTPGPWNEDGPTIYAGINQRTGKIAEVSIAYKDSATYAANAHLIAAAPELYADLERAIELIETAYGESTADEFRGSLAKARQGGDGQ